MYAIEQAHFCVFVLLLLLLHLFGLLKTLVVRGLVQLRVSFPYDFAQLRFQLVHLDAGYLTEHRAAEGSREGQNEADQTDLEGNVGLRVADEETSIGQALDDDRC